MSSIVEFVGLPGTGKTTLSRGVAEELSERGFSIGEPTHEIETCRRVSRIGYKTRLVLTILLNNPSIGFSQTKAVLNSKQKSTSDLFRVLFNLLYVSGIENNYKSTEKIYILDQGLVQGIWAVGFSSAKDWAEIVREISPLVATPSIIVFVETDKTTITERLQRRRGNHSRFSVVDYEFGREGYDQLKSHFQTTDVDTQLLVIENDDRDVLNSNVLRIADEIETFL